MDSLKRITELIRPHWRRILLAALCSAVVAAFNGSFAWIMKSVIDVVLKEGKHILLLALVMFGIFFFRGILKFAQNYLMSSVGAKIVRDMRNSLFGHMVYLPMRHFTAVSTGAMLSKVLNDAEQLQNFLAHRVRDLFVSSGTVIFLAAIAFYRRWDLALIAFVAFPFAFYNVARLGKRLKRVAMRAQEKISTVTESLSESLHGIKIVKSLSAEEKEVRRLGRMNHSYYGELMRITRIEEATGLIMEIFSGFGVGVIIFYGGTLVANGEITTGDFFSFLVAMLLMFAPIKKLTQINNALQRTKALIARFDDILSIPKEADGDEILEPLQHEIEFRNVTVGYPGRDEMVLKDVSMKIKKGQVIAVVGRSGSGKTTLANLLPRFITPASGSVLIDGKDIAGAKLLSLRSQIGIVSQDVILFSGSVRDNIAFGRESATDEEVFAAARAADAHGFISELPDGYNTNIGHGGATLSGGQRQRISIARALMKNPPILILDEATSSLDTQSEMLVQKALDDLIDSGKGAATMTTFVIAHRLSTIKRADIIFILEQGRVVESGSHEQLLSSGGIYSKLYSLQSGESEYLDIDASSI